MIVTWITVVVANFFDIFVTLISLQLISWEYYSVFIVVLIAMGLSVYFFYPETRGYNLEHMALIFDGDNAAASLEESAGGVSSISTEKRKAVTTAYEEQV